MLFYKDYSNSSKMFCTLCIYTNYSCVLFTFYILSKHCSANVRWAVKSIWKTEVQERRFQTWTNHRWNFPGLSEKKLRTDKDHSALQRADSSALESYTSTLAHNSLCKGSFLDGLLNVQHAEVIRPHSAPIILYTSPLPTNHLQLVSKTKY